MLLAFDTYYHSNTAKTVCICFLNWQDTTPTVVYSELRLGIEQYFSGEFYKRELPCILSLLEKIQYKDIEAILIDGYVYLDNTGKAGLGKHLFDKLGALIPVIGVAKTNFYSAKHICREVIRGESRKPLYITSVGVDVDEAATNIKNMSGEYRIPDLLKQLDKLSRM
ncbi:MAG: endonuclease V [Cytophagales bacterium]|nr:endonuclease V [Cytophagales bacterium]